MLGISASYYIEKRKKSEKNHVHSNGVLLRIGVMTTPRKMKKKKEIKKA